MNQIIGAIILFGIVTAVFAPIIAESGSQIFSRSVSISDTIQSARERTGQIVILTNVQYQDGTTILFLSNIGVSDVRIHDILVDGIKVQHSLKDQDYNPVDTLRSDSLGMLEIKGTGKTAQIIATTGKLFEFAMR